MKKSNDVSQTPALLTAVEDQIIYESTIVKMKEVTKDEFDNTVRTLDVVLRNSHTYPYTTSYLLKNGVLKGKEVQSWPNGIEINQPVITKYYIVVNMVIVNS